MTTAPWQRETEDLHAFFEAWLGGDLAQNEANFERLTSVLEPGFVLIGPDGSLSTRAELLENLFAAHGSRRDWRIWIKNPVTRYETSDLVLATYEEWQQSGDALSARLSSALFRQDDKRVGWLHVHETWLRRPDEA